MIQETHSENCVEKIWESEWGGRTIFAHGTNQSRGVALFTSKAYYEKMSNIDTCSEGRFISVDIIENESPITLMVVYAPNEDKPQFFTNLTRLLTTRKEHKIIIGDFNLVLDVELDRENTYCNNNRALSELENMMKEYRLRDVWRVQNGDKREFSWKRKNSFPNKASRIDFALVSGGLDQFIKNPLYLASIKTDHRAFYMVVDTEPFSRGTGYWKLNTTLLQKVEFVELINKELDSCIKASCDKKPTQRWEILKSRVKKVAIDFSKHQASDEKIIISQLSEKVCDYESRLPLDREESELLEITKAELDDKMLERIRGVMFRCKAKWYEYGEKKQ